MVPPRARSPAGVHLCCHLRQKLSRPSVCQEACKCYHASCCWKNCRHALHSRSMRAEVLTSHLDTASNRQMAPDRCSPCTCKWTECPNMMVLTIWPTCRSPSCTRPRCTNRAPPPALCVSSTNTTAEPEVAALLPLLPSPLLLLLLSMLYRWPWSPIYTNKQAEMGEEYLKGLF